MSFPTPARVYDYENEAQFRAQVARLLAPAAVAGTVQSVTLAAGSNNDYALGVSTDLLRITTDASGSTLTGIAAPRSRLRSIVLVNLGSAALTVAHQSASSSAANRIVTPDALSWTLAATDAVTLLYDDTTARWRLIETRPGIGPVALFDHSADANNGTTVETDLYSDTIGAGRLAVNKEKIVAQYGVVLAGDATSTQRVRAYFGGTLVFDTGALAIGVATDYMDIYVTAIRVSASVVRVFVSATSNFAALAATAGYVEVTGLTLANTQVLKITGTAAGATGGSNQITAKEGYVQWLPAA